MVKEIDLMNEWISISIYINKSKNVALVPYKLSEAGFGVASEPIIQVGNEEWDNISQYILGLLDEVSKDPLSKENESTVFKKICGSRGFRYFSKRHICIKVRKKLNDHETIICNFPRLSDGSYGTEKGTISEKYSIKYVSEAEKDLVQENFLKAYLDAQRYLEAIGSKLL